MGMAKLFPSAKHTILNLGIVPHCSEILFDTAVHYPSQFV